MKNEKKLSEQDYHSLVLLVIYKKLNDIQDKLEGRTRLKPMKSYYNDLQKDVEKIKAELISD